MSDAEARMVDPKDTIVPSSLKTTTTAASVAKTKREQPM
jgi:hypothetical protein